MSRAGPQAVNVAEAKRQLSDLLGRVAYAGETILITRRGKPMARLVPPETEPAPHVGDAEGWLEADDPYFALLEEIEAGRRKRRPRALGRRADQRHGPGT